MEKKTSSRIVSSIVKTPVPDYLFECEILIIVEDEEPLGLDIHKLLDEIALHELPTLVSRYLIEFKAFFTQLIKDFVLRQNADFQIKMKINEMRWGESGILVKFVRKT